MSAFIEIKNITRSFQSGDSIIQVLKNINLSINAGEMVAIVGASGSGKSTLMNILGCLDRASSGSYFINGKKTDQFSADELAELRREHFGFIFQRYHLLSALTAEGNVEIPAVYAGIKKAERTQRATEILTRLGLQDKIKNKPSQLSGGQQQRVSIGRALMNGGQIILADEPTGALDRHSGKEVMAILRELHQQGHTIIIVTHDMKIAQSAERIIEISDGEIIADTKNTEFKTQADRKIKQIETTKTQDDWRSKLDRFKESFKMALISMASQRLRTFLTMLGIIIGIASVISVVALGEGSRNQILADINSMGTSTLEISTGKGRGDPNAAKITTLTLADVKVLEQQSYVHSATPNVSTSGYFRKGNLALTGSINGVGAQYFEVRGYSIVQGKGFSEQDVANSAQDGVIDDYTAQEFFKGANPIGQILNVGNLPIRIIGVAVKKTSGFGSTNSLTVWLPYSTVINRMVGTTPLRSVSVRLNDNIDSSMAEKAVTELLTKRHGTKDFNIFNSDEIRKTIESVTLTMALLISSIAVISLVVGGIGVMNIMLVSVTERTQEIGVRMAVGARASDILQQFLIESVLVCLLGGILGILLSLMIGGLFSIFMTSFSMSFTWTSILGAFMCSMFIGVIFGYFPARRAAKMDPIHALERE